MAKKKKKDIPFHIAHNYKSYELKDGTKFWARDYDAAILYVNKIYDGWGSSKSPFKTLPEGESYVDTSN
ncbi:hypothetical protein H8D04_00430 [bacterium]|nr:hypothetical protein [bacterium]